LPQIENIEPVKKYNIEKGDSVWVKWHFEHADEVWVDGVKHTFDPIDSVKVASEYSKEIVVRAYQGNVDSLIDRRSLIVGRDARENEDKHAELNANTENHEDENKDNSGIQRGPLGASREYEEIKGEESEYFKGVAAKTSIPEKLKVVRTLYEKNGDKGLTLYLRALLLDKYGNFVKKSVNKPETNFTLKYGCEEEKQTQAIAKNASPVYSKDHEEGIDFSFLVDCSAAAVDNEKVLSSIRDFASGMTQSDRMQLTAFNHNYSELIPMQEAEAAVNQLTSVSVPAPRGLNAFYKAAYHNLEAFPASSNAKALIIITHFNDNASLIYRASDLIDMAKSKGVPVYVIAVGDAMRTYFLNYICGASGGKIYHIFDDESSNISDILNEIAFGLKNYYQIEFSLFDLPTKIVNNTKTVKCEELFSSLNYESKGEELSTVLNLFPNEIPEYSQYQAVAIFDNMSYEIPNEYNDLLDKLAETLIDNPKYSVELVGNSGDEGDDTFNSAVSLERAESVKSYLVEKGVPAKQILTKGIAYSKPLYFNAKNEWQEGFNRRVEIRWLEPEKYPFEIVAASASTEDEAQYLSDQWQKRGYKSYYERFIDKGEPIYRIKLWGYSSMIEAKSAMNNLMKKYKKDSFYIE
jgi:outer membrane protein OmpA-like peptidoglycan-associated protein